VTHELQDMRIAHLTQDVLFYSTLLSLYLERLHSTVPTKFGAEQAAIRNTRILSKITDINKKLAVARKKLEVARRVRGL